LLLNPHEFEIYLSYFSYKLNSKTDNSIICIIFLHLQQHTQYNLATKFQRFLELDGNMTHLNKESYQQANSVAFTHTYFCDFF